MVKKVVLGVALCGLTGILVVGAVRRTIDKTTQVSGSEGGHGYGRSAESDLIENVDRENNGQQRGSGANRAEASAGGVSGSLGEAAVGQWAIFEGAVTAIDNTMLTVVVEDGDMLLVEGRAWSYAREQGFVAHSDDQLVVRGFYEDGEFKPAQIDNLTSGQSVIVRDDTGRPMWSGWRGRRNS